MTDSQGLSYAAQEAKQYDYDHWLMTLFAPQEKREALFALLAFNSEISRVRETVSEPMLGDIRLQWWREALTGLQKGFPRAHPVVEALYDLRHEISLNYDLMQKMVDMRAKDLDPTPISTDEDLIAYADGTGGALHRLLYSILDGTEDSETMDAINWAGRVYALTGILRAIPFHAHNDLILLPLNRLHQFDLTRYTLFQEEHRQKYLKLVSDVAELTARELKQAKLLARSVTGQGKAVIKTNALSSLYLKKLRVARFDPASRHLTIGSPRKILALLCYRLV